MNFLPSRPVRRLFRGLTAMGLAATSLILLAPTCGGFAPGMKSFSRNSLIIPMDVCYQCTLDDAGANTPYPSACGQATFVPPTGNGFAGQV